MEKINKDFLKSLDKGGRIFKYKKNGDVDDYTLYTVEKKIDAAHFELMSAFDEKENIKRINAEQMIKENCWFFNPAFEK